MGKGHSRVDLRPDEYAFELVFSYVINQPTPLFVTGTAPGDGRVTTSTNDKRQI
jgi:hypothetical protein